jgi:hypothetical protein
MGGLGSGRKRKGKMTTEFITIDLASLRKYLVGDKLRRNGTAEWYALQPASLAGDLARALLGHDEMRFTIERFERPRDLWQIWGEMSLTYHAGGVERCAWLPFTKTTPNYGGARYWFLSPCCGRRARVLYISPEGGNFPTCRECLNLKYQSQRSTYQERHATYERYLLARYGWTWAHDKYHALRHHYQPITPALAAIREASQMEVRTIMLRKLMAHTTYFRKMMQRNLNSLRDPQDRAVYSAYIQETLRELYAPFGGVSTEDLREERQEARAIRKAAIIQLRSLRRAERERRRAA